MRLFRFFVLASMLFVYSINSEAGFEVGSRVIIGSVNIHKNPTKVDLAIFVEDFRFEHNDVGYRSTKKTDWRVLLKNQKGRVINSLYLVTEKDIVDLQSGFGTSKKNIGKKNNLGPYEQSGFVFAYSKEAHLVELYFKGVLKATALVENGN